MNTLKFKTNIKCDGCIAKVTPHLDKEAAGKWKVDISNPDKILTVDADQTNAERIKTAVKNAGYQAEEVGV